MKRRLAVLAASVAALGLFVTPAHASVVDHPPVLDHGLVTTMSDGDGAPPCVQDEFTQYGFCAPSRPVNQLFALINSVAASLP